LSYQEKKGARNASVNRSFLPSGEREETRRKAYEDYEEDVKRGNPQATRQCLSCQQVSPPVAALLRIE
jgi:hypothetical protein